MLCQAEETAQVREVSSGGEPHTGPAQPVLLELATAAAGRCGCGRSPPRPQAAIGGSPPAAYSLRRVPPARGIQLARHTWAARLMNKGRARTRAKRPRSGRDAAGEGCVLARRARPPAGGTAAGPQRRDWPPQGPCGLDARRAAPSVPARNCRESRRQAATFCCGAGQEARSPRARRPRCPTRGPGAASPRRRRSGVVYSPSQRDAEHASHGRQAWR